MLKINFNVPFPYESRNSIIHAFQNLGLKYNHIFSDSVYSQHMVSGKLPLNCRDPNIDIILVDDKARSFFSSHLIDYVEIYFLTERKNNNEN